VLFLIQSGDSVLEEGRRESHGNPVKFASCNFGNPVGFPSGISLYFVEVRRDSRRNPKFNFLGFFKLKTQNKKFIIEKVRFFVRQKFT
jgi:hypothetical protein